jgi:hypothetical protein
LSVNIGVIKRFHAACDRKSVASRISAKPWDARNYGDCRRKSYGNCPVKDFVAKDPSSGSLLTISEEGLGQPFKRQVVSC